MIIVEDGTGLENANSYVSTNEADTYFSTRGVTSWGSLQTEKKEIALIKARDYLDVAYKWRGRKASAEQSCAFPRLNVTDDDGYKVEGIPAKLKEAQMECALIISSGTEVFEEQESNGAVTSENIGGKLSFTYDVSQKLKDKSVYDSMNLRLRGLTIDTMQKHIVYGNIARV